MTIARLLFRSGVASALLAAAPLVRAQDKTAPSSDPKHLYAFQNFIYCSADDGIHGRELWRVNLDGVKELVKDITLGSAGSEIGAFGAVGSVLYFGLKTPTSGTEFWRTDGTTAGTWGIKQFFAGPNGGFAKVHGELNGQIVLTVQDYTEPALWISDGTEAGTRPFVEAESATIHTDFIGDPFLLGDFMYFGAQLKEGGFGVFRSDGTPDGTTLLHKFYSLIHEFHTLDSKLVFFSGETSDGGFEPWVTDGTPENTRELMEMSPGRELGGMGQLQRLDNGRDAPCLVFVSGNAAHGKELWVSDGTLAGTRMLPETIVGPGSGEPGHLIAGEDRVFFSARTPEYGVEVWRADPRGNTIERISDTNPGPADAAPYEFCMMNGSTVVFVAERPEFGEELWIASSDKQPARLVKDINNGPISSYPYYTTALNGQVVYAATTPNLGRELWVTDLHLGTRLLADINTDDSINPSSSPRELTAVGDRVFFVANDIVHGAELWVSDGTPSGTQLLKDLFIGPASSDPRELIAADGWLYFTAVDGRKGERLGRSDGTEAGTVFVNEELVEPQELIAFNGGVYFSGARRLRRDGRELWRVEHTGLGNPVHEIADGDLSSNPHDFTVVGGHLYFLADDGVHGEELWRTDGTNDGTLMVRDIVDAPFEPLSMGQFVGSDGQLIFAGETSSQGDELWSFDIEGRSMRMILDIAQVDTILLEKPRSE